MSISENNFAQELKQKMIKEFDGKLSCSIGNSCKIECQIRGTLIDKINYAVYINSDKCIACVWDISHHRKLKCYSKTLSLSQRWEDVLPNQD